MTENNGGAIERGNEKKRLHQKNPWSEASTEWALRYEALLESTDDDDNEDKGIDQLMAMKAEIDKAIARNAKGIVDENFGAWISAGNLKAKGHQNFFESSIGNKARRYKPISGAGFAGGEKFICEGILFKLATDPKLKGGKYLYGGYKPNLERAAKAAAGELHGANAFLAHFLKNRVPIQVPIITIIDYRGFRKCPQRSDYHFQKHHVIIHFIDALNE
mmetsp:Transcript_16887/g.27895  ORF Transcript_16887/g.27895 Transcript_16887/m.27895 type:complete len:218 (+) Transcript_16887:58-711(+)